MNRETVGLDQHRALEGVSLAGGRFSRVMPLRHHEPQATSWVLKAHDLDQNRDVALKVLNPTLQKGDYWHRAFIREFEFLSHMQGSPHFLDIQIPITSEVASVAFRDGSKVRADILFFGTALGKYDLKRYIELPNRSLRQGLEYCLDIVNGISAIHHAGYVHRDLKPGNVVIMDDGTLNLIDFALTKRLGSARIVEKSEHMRRYWLNGTFEYLPLELLLGFGRDQSSLLSADAYGVGAIVYEILTGRRLFDEIYDRKVVDSLSRLIFSAGDLDRQWQLYFGLLPSICKKWTVPDLHPSIFPIFTDPLARELKSSLRDLLSLDCRLRTSELVVLKQGLEELIYEIS